MRAAVAAGSPFRDEPWLEATNALADALADLEKVASYVV